MNCDGTGQPVSEVSVIFMESQERDHRPLEIPDVLDLGLVTASSVSFLLLGEPFGGSFGFEVSTNALDGRLRRPNAP